MADPVSKVEVFRRSMVIDFDAWHDGTGYDLTVLDDATTAEVAEIESILLARGVLDWRDAEALAAIGTAAALEALAAAAAAPEIEVRNAVARFAPQVLEDAPRTATIVAALATAAPFGGLTSTLDLIEGHHPPEVVDALLRACLDRGGEVAVHCAAMVLFVHGVTDEQFDWGHRPLFLRFDTADRGERVAAFRELCALAGIDPAPYVDRP